MKLAFLVLVLAGLVSGQDYYYGADPAPSMYAQQVGQAVAPPPPPTLDTIMASNQAMAGAPYLGNPAMASTFEAAAAPMPAFFEQQPMAPGIPMQGVQPGAPNFQTEEAVHADNDEEADEELEGNEEEADELEGEVDEMTEDETDDGADSRFAERGAFNRLAHAAKHAAHKIAHKAKRGAHKLARAFRRGGRKIARGLGGKRPRLGKRTFKPRIGKPSKTPRSPSAKTPKSAGGRPMPPMPAPLPVKPKIDCKKTPSLCIDAETPADGEKPGDHSPRAVFKKKMEVIRRALMVNNRNIAQETKWVEQVELIMKQYALKVKKVKEHVADERKAIKELLRQRRIILNEKKQKELELKLKMATMELTALTDALQQVQKKERELGSGKGQLGKKIRLLSDDLKKLRTNKELDEAQALKKSD